MENGIDIPKMVTSSEKNKNKFDALCKTNDTELLFKAHLEKFKKCI